MGKKTESRKHGMRTPSPETEEKYREAIELYRTTGLPVREICARTGVPFTAFRSFLHSCHRELMFARYGMEVAPEEAAATRLRKRSARPPPPAPSTGRPSAPATTSPTSSTTSRR